jgi:hypothetical protein
MMACALDSGLEWLLAYGYARLEDDRWGMCTVTYGSDAIRLLALHAERDDEIAIWLWPVGGPSLRDDPPAAMVDLGELAEALGVVAPRLSYADGGSLESVLRGASDWLRGPALEVLLGRNNELLAGIATAHRAVAGKVEASWDETEEGFRQLTVWIAPDAPPALDQSRSPDGSERAIAALRLWKHMLTPGLERDRAVDRLLDLLADRDERVRRNASVAIGDSHDRRALGPLIDALERETAGGPSSAAFGLVALYPSLAPGDRTQVTRALEVALGHGLITPEQLRLLRARLP